MIRNELGTPIYGLRIVEDVTKRKRLERELVSPRGDRGKASCQPSPRETEVLELAR